MLGGGLTTNSNTTFNFANLTPSGTTNGDLLMINSSLTLGAGDPVTFPTPAGAVASYRLFGGTAVGSLGSGAERGRRYPTGYVYSVGPGSGADAGYYDLFVHQGGGVNKYWVGGNGPTWNLNATANWTTSSGGAATAIYPEYDPATNDSVIFDDNPTGLTSHTLTATVSPNAIAFNNNSTPYTIGGTSGRDQRLDHAGDRGRRDREPQQRRPLCLQRWRQRRQQQHPDPQRPVGRRRDAQLRQPERAGGRQLQRVAGPHARRQHDHHRRDQRRGRHADPGDRQHPRRATPA